MKTEEIPQNYKHISPAGAEVREIMENQHGGIAHCTLKAGLTSKAVKHKTVSEFWHVLAGNGEIWRKADGNTNVTALLPSITIEIPHNTEFQYRSFDTDLVFICITMPPWPNADEVSFIENGKWEAINVI